MSVVSVQFSAIIRRRARLFLALALLLLSSCTGASTDPKQPVGPTATANVPTPDGGDQTAADAAADNVDNAEDDAGNAGQASTEPAILLPGAAGAAESADGAPPYSPTGLIETTFVGGSAALALAPDGTVYMTTAHNERLFFHRSTDGGQTFTHPVHINIGAPYQPTNLDRPVILTGNNGWVAVTWLQITSMERSVAWHAISTDGGLTFSHPQQTIVQRPQHGILLSGSAGSAGRFLFTWLQEGKLYGASSVDGFNGLTEGRVVDEAVCDCCQPIALVSIDAMFIVFRNLEFTEDRRQTRDIFIIRSDDNGATFGAPVSVSDDHWYLDSCPTAGPDMAIGADGRIFVGFTDGRLDDGSLTRADIFTAYSSDGGQTFSPNIRVNQLDGYNRGTAVAVAPDGTVHIAWQAFLDDHQGIYYAVSTDNGQTFSDPWLLILGEEGGGRGHPDVPNMEIGPDGSVHLVWVDELGSHHATWHVN